MVVKYVPRNLKKKGTNIIARVHIQTDGKRAAFKRESRRGHTANPPSVSPDCSTPPPVFCPLTRIPRSITEFLHGCFDSTQALLNGGWPRFTKGSFCRFTAGAQDLQGSRM